MTKWESGNKRELYRDANGKTTGTYNSWAGMMARCYYRNHNRFHRYGGRGIRVCERWHNFVLFLADMGERPEGNRISIERINGDGNYEPCNCRWATSKEQNRNRCTNRVVTCRGESLTVSAWAERTGIGHATIEGRLNSGMSAEQAIAKKDFRAGRKYSAEARLRMTGKGRRFLTVDGKTQCLSAWASDIGLKPHTLIERLKRNWPVREALTTPKTNTRRRYPKQLNEMMAAARAKK